MFPAMSWPVSAIAATTVGFNVPRSSPAEYARSTLPHRALTKASAIWLRALLWMHTNKTDFILRSAVSGAARRARRDGRLGAAARRVLVVAILAVLVDEVRLPAAPLGIARPNLRLVGIAARLFALDIRRVAGGLEPGDLRVDGRGGVHDDAEVLAVAGARIRIEIERQFEPRLFGDEQRVVGEHLRGLGTEQGRVERDARVEVVRREVQVHFHAIAFSGMRERRAASIRSRAPAASR